MYSVTANDITAYRENMNVEVVMTISDTAQTINVSNADIVLGSLRLSRSCVSGSGVEFGNVNASQLQFSLLNYNGQFAGFTFEGAKIFLSFSVTDSTGTHTVTVGYYTIDNSPKIRQTIDIEALDRMTLFDKAVDLSWFALPSKASKVLTDLCTACIVTPATDFTTLDNENYVISSIPSDVTCRQVLSWLCEITGTNAYFDWDGNLVLAWYADANYTVTESERFSSELENYIVAYTGVSVKSGDLSAFSGEGGYVLEVAGNDLIDHDLGVLAASLLTKLQAMPYIPCTMKTMPAPYIYPMDILTYSENGNTYSVIVTDTQYTAGGLTMIEGKGESPQANGYASLNPFTDRERTIITTINGMNETLNTQLQDVLYFNDLITNSLGLYSTDVPQSDGSTIKYLHDKPTLADSMQIFTLTANGIAWTDSGWNAGDPVWQYGVTSAGFALFKRLSAEGIDVQSANTNYHVEITPSTFRILYLSRAVMQINADEITIPQATITEKLDLGAIRIVPVRSGTTTIGTDIYWIGG